MWPAFPSSEYYELVRLPDYLLRILLLQSCLRITSRSNLVLPSSCQFHLLSCCGLILRGALHNSPNRYAIYCLPLLGYTSTLPMNIIFGARILHLYYGLIIPIYQLHTVSYPSICGIGVRLMANLCLPWTFTSKNCQAFLGAPLINAYILN